MNYKHNSNKPIHTLLNHISNFTKQPQNSRHTYSKFSWLLLLLTSPKRYIHQHLRDLVNTSTKLWASAWVKKKERERERRKKGENQAGGSEQIQLLAAAAASVAVVIEPRASVGDGSSRGAETMPPRICREYNAGEPPGENAAHGARSPHALPPRNAKWVFSFPALLVLLLLILLRWYFLLFISDDCRLF